MFRTLTRSLFLSLALASALSAQTLAPTATATIGATGATVGGAPVEVLLSSHFDIDGVEDQLVLFDTIYGKFTVEMQPDHAPNHVVNFLAYVDLDAYDDTILHRYASFTTGGAASGPSIIQGGSFTAELPFESIEQTYGPVNLEYSLPNARGTLAASRLGPNSATTGWYFNTKDNTVTLGPGNDGFGYTVFGRITGNLNAAFADFIAQPWFDFSNFTGFPLRNYTTQDYNNSKEVEEENLITINRISRVNMYPADATSEAALAFSATSANPNVVTATVVGSTLRLTPGVVGSTTVTVRATDMTGMVATQTFAFSTGGVVLTANPQSRNVNAGGSLTLRVTASSTDPLTYQWYRHRSGMSAPEALAGQTAASLVINNVQATDMGSYFVRVSNGSHEVQSAAAVITTTGGSSRLSNLSTRGRIAAGGALTPGFVLRGDGDKPLIMRGIGPQLIEFGLTTGLADPTMDLIPLGGSTPLLTSNNWGEAANVAALAATSATVGAFALDADSLDAAVLADVPLPNSTGSRGYTLKITSTDAAATGIALAEVYDPEAIGADVQLINVSALGFSGTGSDALVPGFVIDGDGAKTMLIRVVGPSLESFGVTGRMANPRLRVVPLGQSFSIAANDDWAGAAALQSAFTVAGAFDFASAASLDAAVVVRLPPGGYTVVVEGADGGTGTVLVEAYDLD
ncbi:peptidylprolyl isomerase [Synoicihabitans lomoniglobus]|uniref:peptidylprolyl isomerase n=1 Tax=Synoicihabitans lomoniglobus TaxID=2909285 RepID=A0AAF0CPN6_9BACT|nr:peptidylprolyl isomerase [Opitutaceae bacterium LMO-M01]WED65689.1 peptidylprolyl isomerase [Opitutaceae bacterium LMO-M01]